MGNLIRLPRYCKACGTELPEQQGRGRLAAYCSDACKQRGYRQRKEEFRNADLLRNSERCIDLIFCAGDNRRFFQIAAQEGFLLGIRSGRASYGYDMQFVDNEYRRPNFAKHLSAVVKHRPKYATVPDLSDHEVSERDVARALHQYEQLTPYCEIPLIVPKLPGQIGMLPPHVAIGYSIPTSYGGATYGLWELTNRRVHLLGGSPHEQMHIYQSLSGRADVMSVDGNMAMMMARQYAEFWQAGQWLYHPERGMTDDDLYLECWRWSCHNIRHAWERFAMTPPRQLALFAE